MPALAASEQPEGEIGRLPDDAEQFMPALSDWPTAGQQPAPGPADQARPMREGATREGIGQISPASSQHRPASAHARKINGGQGAYPGGIRAKARKKIQRVRVRLPNRT